MDTRRLAKLKYPLSPQRRKRSLWFYLIPGVSLITLVVVLALSDISGQQGSKTTYFPPKPGVAKEIATPAVADQPRQFAAGVLQRELTDLSKPASSGTEEILPVPSDVRATYRLISVKPGKKQTAVVVTKREGPSGQSHSRRECSCPPTKWRYLGDGETLADAMRDRNPIDPMRPIEAASNGAWPPSFYVCVEACKRVGRESQPASKNAATVPAPPPAQPEFDEFDVKSRALVLCQRYAKAASKQPSTVNFSGWGAQVSVGRDGSAKVVAPFTAHNTLGIELPHKIDCSVSPSGSITAQIIEQ